MKETIYDLLNKYQITCNISEELTDTELGYLYLKMKSDIVNNCFDVLKEQYKRKDLFNANLKILFELAIDYPYRASFSNNLKEAISMFVVSGREILKEDKDDEDFLIKWNLLNELICERNNIVETNDGKERLIKEEIIERNFKNNQKYKNFINHYYRDLIKYDYVIYFIYYIYLANNKDSELYEKFNNPSIISSACNHLYYLNEFVKVYSCEEMYIKVDALRVIVRKKLEELEN
ncbi:MAG: hypothetical protein SOX86_02790 [Bacilli bacterium]|nr:hypothetical protein [Bacilli bacterium]